MIFIETSVVTKQITALLSDDSYRLLQSWIAGMAERGELIRGNGGCRKIRWMAAGKGTRGGIRVIYYWVTDRNQILMLLAYNKAETADLDPQQIRKLGEWVRAELRQSDERTTL